MSITVEGRRSVHFATSARLVEDGREMAWAENIVSSAKGPDVKFLVGNYVQASTPEATRPNSNGHIFEYADLQKAIKGIPHRPLNINHSPGRRVGTLAAAEFVYPMDAEGAAEDGSQPPIIEVLGALWQYYEPEIMPAVEMAHKEGSLYLSMEAVPQDLTCKGKGENPGCGRRFAYDGRTSQTYCSCLNEMASRKILHSPMFTASALILPPTRPGWKGAHVKELAQIVEDHITEAEAIYDQLAVDAPHLDAREWEHMTAWFLKATLD